MSFGDLTNQEQDKVIEALKWFGMPTAWCQITDICESGSVYVGLIEILPRGSVEYVEG